MPRIIAPAAPSAAAARRPAARPLAIAWSCQTGRLRSIPRNCAGHRHSRPRHRLAVGSSTAAPPRRRDDHGDSNTASATRPRDRRARGPHRQPGASSTGHGRRVRQIAAEHLRQAAARAIDRRPEAPPRAVSAERTPARRDAAEASDAAARDAARGRVAAAAVRPRADPRVRPRPRSRLASGRCARAKKTVPRLGRARDGSRGVADDRIRRARRRRDSPAVDVEIAPVPDRAAAVDRRSRSRRAQPAAPSAGWPPPTFSRPCSRHLIRHAQPVRDAAAAARPSAAAAPA